MIEFAIVLPLLIMLLFGVIEFGRLAFTQIRLNDAVQEGSIYASTHPDETDEIIRRVRGNFGSHDDEAYVVTVTCLTDEEELLEEKLLIEVSHNMTTFMPLLLPDSFPLDAAVTTDIFTSTGECP